MSSIKRKASAMILILYTVGYFIWILTYNRNQFSGIIISDILQIIPPVIVFTLLLKTYLKAKHHNSKFWLFLAIGCGSNLLAIIATAYCEIAPHNDSVEFAINAFLLGLSITSYITALTIKLKEKKQGNWTQFFILDTLTTMCIAIAVTWIYAIQPSFNSLFSISLVPRILMLLYPIVNLICLFVSVNLYFSVKPNDGERTSLYIICVAFFLMFSVNLICSHLSIHFVCKAGNYIDPLWSLFIMLLGYAAIEFTYSKTNCKKDKEVEKFETAATSVVLIAPFLSVLLLFTLMMFFHSSIIWLCSALGISLITLRHALTIHQNKHLIIKLGQLNNTLEGKVTQRTHELYNMAFYDQLTSLPNRRMFEGSLKKSVFSAYQNNTPLALMFLDLDRFKTINDNFGHSYGDLMLRVISDRISNLINENCSLSRQGGDEFALIIENYISIRELEDLAQKIITETAKPIELLEQNLHTTCSIGIALYSSNCEDPETLMRYADAAMYYSKEKGKNTYQFYTEELDKSISKKLELETELSKALENNEFSLYYQPQINTVNGVITGAEALLRWKHPILGFVSPQDFIPIAEESGMIKEIGYWVLKTACTQAKQWYDEGFENLKVGVNISPKQIQTDNFVNMVADVINETKLPPGNLDLEITESASFQNEADVIEKLHELKKLGVQISIDDFGTGYSSLSYLNKLPVDTLKIAQQFVRLIKSDGANKAIISSIIAVAQSLKLKVIAEGVEEAYQYNFLKSQNCFDMQGYMFSKPIPLHEFRDLIENKINGQNNKLDE